MPDSQKELVIKDFQKAIGDSPHVGHGLMRNIDIEAFPGAMKSKRRMLSMFNSVQQRTWTNNTITGVITASATLQTQNEIDNGNTFAAAAVTLTTTGSLPTGLSTGTVYYVVYLSNTTFKFSNTITNALGGVSISLVDTGTGIHTIVPVPLGTINHIVKDPITGLYFVDDSNGKVWSTIVNGGNSIYLMTGNGTTGANGNGLSLFKVSDGSKTYLFSFRSAKIDVVEVTAPANVVSPSWTNDWKSLNSGSGTGNPHFAKLGQDNITYFCDDRYVGSILENPGSVFAPASSGTYTYNNQALNLPQNEIAQCLEELGVQLLTGGATFNKIYPWDRVSPSFTLPIPVPERNIQRMKNTGNTILILAGVKGNVYSTQGSYAKLFKTVPGYVKNNTTSNSTITWGDIIIRSNGAVFLGLGTVTSGNSGVYVLYDDARLVQDNTPYQGSANATALWADTDGTLITGSPGGLDYLDQGLYAAGTFASVYQSALYRVGNKTEKATYSTFEIQTAKPAANGQMRLSYRFDTSSAFTVVTGSSFTADGLSTSFENSEWGVIDIENIQFQLEFDADFEIMQIKATP